MNKIVNPSRRGFLKSAVVGSLVVSLPLPSKLLAQTGTANGKFNSFISIAPDGQIDLSVPTFEIGQGAHTSLGMILADELGANWDDVNVLTPKIDPNMNVAGWNAQIVAGSYSVRLWYGPLRQAAAAAREMLAAAAAQEWGVPAGEIQVSGSQLSHPGSSNSAAFGDFAEAAAGLAVPTEPALRDDLHLIGTSVPRVDLAGKVNGTAVYGIDVRVPGMAYAAIRHAPTYKALIENIDRGSLEGLQGVIDVVELPHAVMVVAETFWTAKQAVDALDVTFSQTEFDGVDTDQIMAEQRAQLERKDGGIAFNEGDAETAISAAAGSNDAQLVVADYTVPFLYHGPMEPMTCTARVDGDTCTVWAPTQDLTTATNTAAAAADVLVENVEVNAIYAGGGFGRKYEQDFVEQAVVAAKQVGRPVQLIWSREEDVQHDFYRPAVSARMRGALGPDGNLDALAIRLVGPSVIEHSFGVALLDGVDPVTTIGVSTETGNAPGKIQQYSIEAEKLEYIHQPTHVPVGYWRAVGASHNGFFIESFIDELAHAAKADAYQFRRALLKDSPRGLAVLDRVASAAGWGQPLPDGHFHGIAFSEAVGSLLGYVVEVSVAADNTPTVHKVTIAIDCGIAINPDSVEAQVVGCAIMGLSAALNEEVVIEDGRARHENFYDYEILQMGDIPEIEAIIVESGAAPGGVGEAAIPGIAPALTNAIFAANGQRIRSLPIMSNLG